MSTEFEGRNSLTPTPTRVFKFIRDVRYEPGAQFAPHKAGSQLRVDGRRLGPKLSKDAKKVIMINGLGTTDEFVIGEDIEEIKEDEQSSQGSSEPKDRLDFDTGKLVPTNQPAAVCDQNVFDPEDSESRTFSPSQSPTPTPKAGPSPFNAQPTGQWFGDVIEDLLDGAKVRRLSWPEGECVFFKPVRFSADSPETTDVLTIKRAGGEHNWLVARQDLENANDWVVVGENVSESQPSDEDLAHYR